MFLIFSLLIVLRRCFLVKQVVYVKEMPEGLVLVSGNLVLIGTKERGDQQ